ncbi:MAG: carboxypeptidase regulatory-like domain-containing protein [Acidobacteria bacterium]|nr:carboxypeptidase regulatory-like domain-containing protein [Acidobacteriota bacterium]
MRAFSLAVTCLGMMFLLSSSPAWSQAITGTVSGLVTDQQNAAIAGAEVKITDAATGKTLSTISNDAGRYIFLNVSPGSYAITVTKPGFSTHRFPDQTVQVGQVLTINAVLEVGQTSTTIEVSAAAGSQLQTTNASVGSTLAGPSMIFLPNMGRDASTFAIFQPGVSPEGSVAGAMYDQNTFLLDGGNNSNDMDGSMRDYTGSFATNGAPSGVLPTPVESVEEFKVSTSGQTADFNGSSGSQVQMATKRGTNTFHGSGYEYYFARNVGAANTWDGNHTPAKGFPYTPLPVTHTNRFGGSLGGELIPKRILGGKTYFFVNYEGYRFPQSAVYERQVPTALLRAGVIQINQAGTWTAYNLNPFPVTVNGTTYQPATCPAGSCDPRGIGLNSQVSQLWQKYMPLPNDPLAGDHFNTQGYLSNIALPQHSNNYVSRIDHDFSEKWRFMASYRYYRFVKLGTQQVDIGGALPGDTLGTPAARAVRPQVPSFWVAGLTTNVTPTITNDFRFSYLRNFWQWGSSSGPAQLPGLGGALEIGGETAAALIPYNVNTQNVRQRFWDGQDKTLKDDVTMIRGNHLIQFGGMYERNYDYHLRDDNGQGIGNWTVYQIGASNMPGITFSSNYQPVGLPTNQISNYNRLYAEVLGIVHQPQTLYTRTGKDLTLQPLGSDMYDQSIIPYYNMYVSDSWHIKPSVTLTYGAGYMIEMPPYELNGKQVALTDASGKSIVLQNYLDARQAAALKGQVYNPTLGWATVLNADGGQKYPYDPFYGGFSPRVAAAWNPHYNDGILGKLLGNGKTVVRAGYGRIFSRLNGVGLVLVPLLGTGLGQAVSCIGASSNGQCLGNGAVTPATAFRIGTDGMVAPLPAVSKTLAQPYIPGFNGNASSGSGSILDRNFRPASTDNLTISIQREVSSKVMVEVGYIGRRIQHEWQQVNFDAVPYMTTLNGQSFAQAFANMYFAVNAGGVPAVQPFFESALGGANSAFCQGFGSCTAAVAKNSTMKNQITTVSVYDFWATLNRNNSWTLGRTMPSSPINGGSGQLSAVYANTSNGFGNYNAAYFTFTTQNWHGITTHSNFTWGRALGTGNQSQATSSYTVVDPWDLHSMYGPQFFDYKFLYNLSILWEDPFYKSQRGLVGHLLGGWRIAPLFTVRSGAPLFTSNLNGNCQSFGEANCATGSTNDGAVLAAPYTGGTSAYYNQNVTGSVGTNANYANGGVGTQMFANPTAVYNEFRPCILGFDTNCGAGVAGGLRGLSSWNLDATASKDIGIWKEGRVGATLMFQITNVLNHVVLGDPSMDISDPSSFGVLGGQANTPRQMEFGVRVHF